MHPRHRKAELRITGSTVRHQPPSRVRIEGEAEKSGMGMFVVSCLGMSMFRILGMKFVGMLMLMDMLLSVPMTMGMGMVVDMGMDMAVFMDMFGSIGMFVLMHMTVHMFVFMLMGLPLGVLVGVQVNVDFALGHASAVCTHYGLHLLSFASFGLLHIVSPPQL